MFRERSCDKSDVQLLVIGEDLANERPIPRLWLFHNHSENCETDAKDAPSLEYLLKCLQRRIMRCFSIVSESLRYPIAQDAGDVPS